jgi:hypothetical protein
MVPLYLATLYAYYTDSEGLTKVRPAGCTARVSEIAPALM